MIEPTRHNDAKRNDFFVAPKQRAMSKMSGGRGNQLASKRAIVNSAAQPQRLPLHESTQSYSFFTIIPLVIFRAAKLRHLFKTANYAAANN